VWLATLVILGHTAAQGQTFMQWVWFSCSPFAEWVWRNNRSLGAFSVLFTLDVCGRPHLSAPITLVRLLLNISIHSYTPHCGKQFCPLSVANCRWVSAPFSPSEPTSALLQVACLWCRPLVKQLSSRFANLTQANFYWTTLAACHRPTLSNSKTRPQQWCRSYKENIPIIS
jgi:hypothetical protein